MRGRKLIIAILQLLLILSLSSYVFAESPAAGKVIKTSPGENFTIALESNASTGFTWEFSNPLDKELLILVDSFYEERKTELVGAPGKQVWIFKALKSGSTAVDFQYLRPWEKDLSPEKKESFTIVITEKEPDSRVHIGGDVTVTSVNRKGF